MEKRQKKPQRKRKNVCVSVQLAASSSTVCHHQLDAPTPTLVTLFAHLFSTTANNTTAATAITNPTATTTNTFMPIRKHTTYANIPYTFMLPEKEST